MSTLLAVSQALKYFIPSLFSMLLRVYGLGVKSRKRAAIGMTAFAVVGIGLPLLVISFWGYDVYKKFTTLIVIVSYLPIFYFSSDSFLPTLYLHLSQMNVVFWISTFFGGMRRIFQISYPVHDLILIVVCAAFYFLTMRCWVRPLRFTAENIRRGWLTVLAVPACTVCAGIIISIYLGSESLNNMPLMLLFITLISLGFMLYMAGLYRSMREIAELTREQGQSRMLEAELAYYDSYLDMARQSRHDLRHHNAVLGAYLSEGDLDGARRYLGDYDADLAASGLMEYCKNKSANAVLRIYAKKAKKAGISFAIRADIPEETSLPAQELAAMLSNLLENAWNACQLCSAQQRFMALTAEEENEALHLAVRNSVSGAVRFAGDRPVSPRPDGGVGTLSVCRIVDKHNGVIRFAQNGGEFVVQAVIPNG